MSALLLLQRASCSLLQRFHTSVGFDGERVTSGVDTLGSAATGDQQGPRDFYGEAGGVVTVALVGIAATASGKYAKSRLRPLQLDRFFFGMGILGVSVVIVSVIFLHSVVVVTGGVTLAVTAVLALLETPGREE